MTAHKDTRKGNKTKQQQKKRQNIDAKLGRKGNRGDTLNNNRYDIHTLYMEKF